MKDIITALEEAHKEAAVEWSSMTLMYTRPSTKDVAHLWGRAEGLRIALMVAREVRVARGYTKG